jgi:RNA polymerase sigma factor (sigma-70 family)
MTAQSIAESPEIVPIFDKPGRDWTPEETRLVKEWMLQDQQYQYLLHFALYHLHVEEIVMPEVMAKNAEDAWHDFYLKQFAGVTQSYNPPVSFPLFDMADVRRSTHLVSTLRQKQDALTQYAREQLRSETRQLLMTTHDVSVSPEALVRMLVEDLNQMLRGVCVYVEARFTGVRLRQETRQRLTQEIQGTEGILVNRLLLEDGFPGAFVRRRRFWNYLLFCLERFCHVEGRKIRRAHQRQQPLATGPEMQEDVTISVLESDTTDNPETLVQHAEQQKAMREKVSQGVQSLRLSYREVLVKHYFEDLSVVQIAAALGLSEANVKVRLFRGRQQLAHLLQDVAEGE